MTSSDAAVAGQGSQTTVARPLDRGVYVPTLAFFDPGTEQLDIETLRRHTLRLAAAGVTGIVVQGSNGEAVHLMADERSRMVKETRDCLDGGGFSWMPLLVGCGAQSTTETIALCRQAAADGGDYALVLPPSYYRDLFTETTVADFFTDVADASPIPVIIYNYPGATAGVDISSDLLIELSHHRNLVGCKFTCGNTGKLGRVAASVRSSGQQFLCFAGSADFVVASLAHGGAGLIGGLANIAPRSAVYLLKLAEAGERAEAARVQSVIADGDWVLIRTGLVGAKAALVNFFGYGGWARKPLPRPDKGQVARITEGLRKLIELEVSLS